MYATGTPGNKIRDSYRVWMLKYGIYIHGDCLCDRLSENEEHLLVAERGRGALCEEARCEIQPKLEPAHSAGPRAF